MTNRLQDIRSVVLLAVGQFLYTAGAAVTSGSFLTYFVKLWSPSAALMAWFFILPELVHTGSFLTAKVIRRFGSAKRVWLVFGLLARTMLLAIAAVGWFDPQGTSATSLIVLLSLLALGELSQAISYVALITWLSEVFGRASWGKLFGWRQFAIVTAAMMLPPVAAAIRDWLAGAEFLPGRSFSLIFIAANGLVLLGIFVLMWLPDRNGREDKRDTVVDTANSRAALRNLFSNFSYCRVLLTGVHLAAAQGLTQTVLFFYQVNVLNLSLSASVGLSTLMYFIQQPTSIWVGRLVDRFDNRVIYAGGLALVSLAMPFWFLAQVDWRWAIGAYVFWGAFAVVNLAGRNSVLRVTDHGDRPTAIGLFRFGAGLVAAIAGLLGGYWLDLARDGQFVVELLGPYLTIIAVSTVGRATVCFWLVGWSDDKLIPSAKTDPTPM